MQKDILWNSNQKKAGMIQLKPDKDDFKTKKYFPRQGKALHNNKMVDGLSRT